MVLSFAGIAAGRSVLSAGKSMILRLHFQPCKRQRSCFSWLLWFWCCAAVEVTVNEFIGITMTVHLPSCLWANWQVVNEGSLSVLCINSVLSSCNYTFHLVDWICPCLGRLCLYKKALGWLNTCYLDNLIDPMNNKGRENEEGSQRAILSFTGRIKWPVGLLLQCWWCFI